MDRGRPRPPPRSFGARAGQRLRKRDIPGGRGRPRSINICVRLHACMSRSDAERGLLSIFLPPFTGDVRPKAGMGALQAPNVPLRLARRRARSTSPACGGRKKNDSLLFPAVREFHRMRNERIAACARRVRSRGEQADIRRKNRRNIRRKTGEDIACCSRQKPCNHWLISCPRTAREFFAVESRFGAGSIHFPDFFPLDCSAGTLPLLFYSVTLLRDDRT